MASDDATARLISALSKGTYVDFELALSSGGRVLDVLERGFVIHRLLAREAEPGEGLAQMLRVLVSHGADIHNPSPHHNN